jgi:Acyclic terpene utilisation family protein AtuA
MRQIVGIAPTSEVGDSELDRASFELALREQPDFIGAQAGSCDVGPLYLGADLTYTNPEWTKHDIEAMLVAARERDIPLIIGSAIGCGSDRQADFTAGVVREVAREQGLSFKLATIYAEQDKEYLREKLRAGRIRPLGRLEELDEERLDRTDRVTAMMGVEPLVEALRDGADVIIAGRCTDAAIFAALPILRGFDAGLAWHMGKILECACAAAEYQEGRTSEAESWGAMVADQSMVGIIREDHLVIAPAAPRMACTVTSVAAHSMYERQDPFVQPEPGGSLDLSGTQYEQLDDRSVKITGTRFEPQPYTVKLEGSARLGSRALAFVGVRDPLMIADLDDLSSSIERVAREVYGARCRGMAFHQYGRDAVMKELEPLRHAIPHEVGFAIETLAETQELAVEICEFALRVLGHMSYEGMKQTAGNIAYLGSQEVFVPVRDGVYEWSIEHVMELDSFDECFRTVMEEVTGR